MKEIEEKIEELREEVKQLELLLQKPDFWQNKEEAAKIQKRYSFLKDRLKLIVKTKGKYDKGPAILSISSGAGGRDAEDWTALLVEMYQRYARTKGWTCKILTQTFTEGGGPEGRIGLKSVIMEIKEKGAYGILKKETGVHRLVRISPFSAKGLRHTSFAKVEVLPQIEGPEEPQIKLDPEDLKIETFRASGPGGQYVNRRESAVRITHLPTGLRVACQAERLQGENRKRAIQILIAKLYNLHQREKQKEIERIKGRRVSPEFGNQIRSYIFHPYKLVKDLRTGVETSDVEGVLAGNLNKFIEAEIKI
ncbi:PCRF domain-containing protein [Patescibacteria group bacterium]|nr:PCRF domain-containing protein [Patescibacteria group bacterium]